MNSYAVGSVVELDGSFKDENGASIDPTTVIVTVKSPSGTLGTPTVSKDGTGEYSALYTISEAGVHQYRVEGTGAVVVASEGAFVAETVF